MNILSSEGLKALELHYEYLFVLNVRWSQFHLWYEDIFLCCLLSYIFRESYKLNLKNLSSLKLPAFRVHDTKNKIFARNICYVYMKSKNTTRRPTAHVRYDINKKIKYHISKWKCLLYNIQKRNAKRKHVIEQSLKGSFPRVTFNYIIKKSIQLHLISLRDKGLARI